MRVNPVLRALARGLLLTALVSVNWSSGVSFARGMNTFTVTKTADTADGVCNADCSLREAIIAANSAGGQNTINVPDGMYSLTIAGANEDSAATGDLDIVGGNLSIVGTGQSGRIISGNNLDRVFDVRNGAQVQISGVSIQDGRLNTNLEVDGSGAGIRVLSGSLSLSSVEFRNNTAMLYGGAIMYGFRLPFSGGSPVGLLQLDRVSITSNQAPAAGAGIFLGQGAHMQMTDTLVNGNRVSGNNVVANSGIEGGAGLFVFGSAYTNGVYTPGVVSISRSTFDQNTSMSNDTATGGGAIYMGTSETSVDISDSIFTRNETQLGNFGFGGSGGAINNDGAVLTVTHSTFSDNASMYSAGAIMVSGGRVAIDASSLTGNSARGGEPLALDCGGAIKANHGALLNIDGTVVASNTAVLSGGGLCFKEVEATLNNLQIYGNTAQVEGVGGGVFNTGRLGTAAENAVRITNSSIHHNTAADGRGGGIANVSGGVLTVSDSEISENTAASGGGIEHYIGFALFVTNTRIVSNTADMFGGGLATRNDVGCSNNVCPLVPQLTDVTIQNNTVLSDANESGGGGIYNMVSVRLNRVTISDNQAQQGGGLLSFHNGTADFPNGVEATNVTFNNNIARDSGGGAYIALGVASFNNTTFAANSAMAGGGLFTDPNTMPSVSVKNSLLANNGASNGADCGGTIISGDYNIIRDMFGCTATGTTINNITNQDPVLGLLADNGGATWTRALLIGSPAINHGNPAGGSCAATDQRQADRSGQCDIGAFEFGSAAPTPTPTPTLTPVPTLTRTPSPTASATAPGGQTSTPTATVVATHTATATATTPGGQNRRLVYVPLVRR